MESSTSRYDSWRKMLNTIGHCTEGGLQNGSAKIMKVDRISKVNLAWLKLTSQGNSPTIFFQKMQQSRAI
jgi:hypothetical protein